MIEGYVGNFSNYIAYNLCNSDTLTPVQLTICHMKTYLEYLQGVILQFVKLVMTFNIDRIHSYALLVS